ncbi:MAG: L,D-transpeptidase [Actinomycetota bacterium]
MARGGGDVRLRVRTAAALAMAVALSACAGPVANLRAAPPPASRVVSPAIDVDSVPHGRMPAHRRLVLPDRAPYGVVSDHRYLPLYKSPWGPNAHLHIDTWNPLRERLRFPVQEVHPAADGSGWLRILLPDWRLGRSAWVRSDDVRVVSVRERLVVDLSAFTIRHYREGKLLHSFSVGIGRPEYPTPKGTYFIWAHVPQGMPNGPYGVFALGTSAFSAVIEDGRVGVHGTADPSDRGQRVSHGCIRVYNTDMMKLRRVPLGTPLVIHA